MNFLMLQVCYLDLLFSAAVVSSAIGLVWWRGSLTASRKIHDALLENVIKSPMFFFDKTPLGRIMGRCELLVRVGATTTYRAFGLFELRAGKPPYCLIFRSGETVTLVSPKTYIICVCSSIIRFKLHVCVLFWHRFSKDLSSVDNSLPLNIRRQVHCVMVITMSVIVIMTSLPQMLVVFVLLMTLYFYLKVAASVICSSDV